MTAYDEVRATLAEVRIQNEVLGLVAGVYGSSMKVPEHADAIRAETALDLRDCLQAAEQRAYELGHPEDWDERRYLVSWRRALAVAVPLIAAFAELVSRDGPADFDHAHDIVAGLVSFDLEAEPGPLTTGSRTPLVGPSGDTRGSDSRSGSAWPIADLASSPSPSG